MRLIHKASQTLDLLAAKKHHRHRAPSLAQVPALHHPAPEAPRVDHDAARASFEKAFHRTYRWPQGFHGFLAHLSVNESGRVANGSATVSLPSDVRVILPDCGLQAWTQEALATLVTERTHCSLTGTDAQFPLTCGPDDSHPLGRLITVHGCRLHSQYRIHDYPVLQITRTFGTMRCVVTVKDSIQTPDGRHLATHYTVHYFNTREARLVLVESFKDTHVLVGSVVLPARRLMILNEGDSVLVRTLTLRNHRLL